MLSFFASQCLACNGGGAHAFYVISYGAFCRLFLLESQKNCPQVCLESTKNTLCHFLYALSIILFEGCYVKPYLLFGCAHHNSSVQFPPKQAADPDGELLDNRGTLQVTCPSVARR
ncbi:TPA: hypothetical protein ACH3X2_004130 [Trebouxia sp. C0005]